MTRNSAFAASELAAQYHDGQFRNDNRTPYIVHPARVAMTVALATVEFPTVCGVPREQMIAVAWAHDLLEDTIVSYDCLSVYFTRDAIEMIKLLTSNKDVRKTRAERKALERERLMPAIGAVRLIKLADRLDNVMDIDKLPEDFRSLYARESCELVAALTHNSMCSPGMKLANEIHERIKPYL